MWNVGYILALHFSHIYFGLKTNCNWDDQLPGDIPIKGFYCNISLETLFDFRMKMC